MARQAQIVVAGSIVGESSRARRTAFLTAVALGAFAANSLLCRLALSATEANPASFTMIRLGAGAIMLYLLNGRVGAPRASRRGNWGSAIFLFLYAIAFSFAYVGLTAGTGALILFAAVQMTMILTAALSGERLGASQLSGIFLTLSGLIYLLLPGLTAPAPVGAALMVLAGVSWGVYSLRGRSEVDPVGATAGNFKRAAALALMFGLAFHESGANSPTGILLAAASGALASGLGYVVWYAALGGLTAARAAAVQLAVPVIAALGGVAFLSEELTARLAVSAVVIFAGIAVTLGAPGSGGKRQGC